VLFKTPGRRLSFNRWLSKVYRLFSKTLLENYSIERGFIWQAEARRVDATTQTNLLDFPP
jgi:hypothetical protein